jgi:tRNA A-37 threonylcarbamoyl transferase component Bud32
MSPLDWEHNWIDNNLHRYESLAHAALVKRNIAKRYRRNALIARLRVLRAAVRVLN